MKVHLDRIPDGGFRVDELGPWALDAAAEALEGRAERVEGELLLTAYGDEVRVTGELTVHARRPCDRCAVDLQVELGGEVDLHYVPSGSRAAEDNRTLNSDELDIGFYEGGAIDLAAVVQEYFALLTPGRLACEVPGARVADGESCGAPEQGVEPAQPVDPRFAVLAGLKLDD